MDGWEADEMTLWNEIATDFDPEEETANFGTRRALEADGNLYEVRNYNIIELKFEPVINLGDHPGHHRPLLLPLLAPHHTRQRFTHRGHHCNRLGAGHILTRLPGRNTPPVPLLNSHLCRVSM